MLKLVGWVEERMPLWARYANTQWSVALNPTNTRKCWVSFHRQPNLQMFKTFAVLNWLCLFIPE
ncbi:MAG: hypothetical protein KME64_40205 [Scytonematopsis contorta HA4267-MV1]|nr:hypothetical protein [Scytonematopsis contorta HA4267-MV1]